MVRRWVIYVVCCAIAFASGWLAASRTKIPVKTTGSGQAAGVIPEPLPSGRILQASEDLSAHIDQEEELTASQSKTPQLVQGEASAGSEPLHTPPEPPPEQDPSIRSDDMLALDSAMPSYGEVAWAIDQVNSETPSEELARVASAIIQVEDPRDHDALLQRLDERLAQLKAERQAAHPALQAEAELGAEPDAEEALKILQPDPVELQGRLARLDLRREEDMAQLTQLASAILSIEREEDREALLRLLEEKLQER